jgi:hypothetical protein
MCTATGCQPNWSWQIYSPFATEWTVRRSNPGDGEIFRICPDRPRGPPSLLYSECQIFTGGKAAGLWLWPHTQSSADVKERVELYLYSSFGPLWPVLGWTLPSPLLQLLSAWCELAFPLTFELDNTFLSILWWVPRSPLQQGQGNLRFYGPVTRTVSSVVLRRWSNWHVTRLTWYFPDFTTPFMNFTKFLLQYLICFELNFKPFKY